MRGAALLDGPQAQAIEVSGLHEIQVELARRNLIDFCRLLGPSGFTWGAAQVAICDHVQRCIEGEFTRAHVNLPPRAGKSMISSVMTPAWYIGQFPRDKVILLTGNLLLTTGFVEQLIALLQSEEYREVFPDFELLDASVNRINFRSRANPRGERGRLTTMSISRAAQGVGANLLLADDLISEQDALSKIVKDSIWNRWQSGLVTRLDPLKNRIICIATRWARDDPLGRMIAHSFEDENGEPFRVLRVPVVVDREMAARINKVALQDPIFEADLDAGKVQLLDPGGTFAPERFTQAFVEKQKASLTAEQFSALYLQSPTPEQGSIFRRSMFKPLGKDMMREMKPAIAYSIMTVDTAFKAEDTSDYTAMLHVGVVPVVTKRGGQEFVQNTLIALDAFQDRVQPADLAGVIKRRYRDWGPRQIVIEDAASGTMIIQQLRRAMFPLVGFNPRKLPKGKNAKEERASLAALLISSQPIFYDERNASLQAALQAWLEFPRSDFDDLTDCLVMSIMYLRGRNEFDSSWQTWGDEVERMRDEFDPDDEPQSPPQRSGLRRHDGPRVAGYGLTMAARQRTLRDMAQRNAPKSQPIFSSMDIRFDDD